MEKECNVSYSYSEDGLILIREFRNKVTMKDIIDSWEEIVMKDMIPQNVKGVVTNFNSCELNINPGELDEIYNFFQRNIHYMMNLKIAVVIDSPKVVFPTLFKLRYSAILLESFCTKEAAIKWILN